jgi:hypothetical protein
MIKVSPRETMVVTILLIAFVVLNITISERSWNVWLDEVMFTDPAANLLLGNGFTSSAWFFQTKHEFWAGNAPLYAIVLFHWMKLFGFSPVAVRSLNYVLMGIAVLTLWMSAYRLDLIRSSAYRLALIAMLLLSEGVSLNYLGGRYDCLGILLFACMLLTFSVSSLWMRCALLLCISIFIPIAGIHLLPYAIVLGLLLFVFTKWTYIKEFISAGIGLTLGVLFLYLLYLTNGVANVFFIRSIGGFMLSSTIRDSSVTKASDAEKIHYVLTHVHEILGTRLANFAEWFGRDKSFLFLIIIATGLLAYVIKDHQFRRCSLLSFGLLASVIIPIVLGILRDFPISYSWMSFIPLCVCMCSTIDELSKNIKPGIVSLLIMVILIGIGTPGYPYRLYSTFRDWDNRDYTLVERFIDENIMKGDRAYSDFGPYYAIKRKADEVYLPTYLDVITPKERDCINVLVRNDSEKMVSLEEAISIIGGEWYNTNQSLNLASYNLKIFRRKGVSVNKCINTCLALDNMRSFEVWKY